MNTIEKPRLLVAIKNLKFQDAAIEKINLVEDDYSYIDRETQTVKFKKQIYIPFDVSKNTHLKGLKLCVFKNTNTKSFVVQFWHDNKAKYHVLGKYISGIFTTKHCSEKLFELFKSHTDNGLWIKDPSLTEKERRRVINIDQIEAAQNKTGSGKKLFQEKQRRFYESIKPIRNYGTGIYNAKAATPKYKAIGEPIRRDDDTRNWVHDLPGKPKTYY
jgi:hypothetical protein